MHTVDEMLKKEKEQKIAKWNKLQEKHEEL